MAFDVVRRNELSETVTGFADGTAILRCRTRIGVCNSLWGWPLLVICLLGSATADAAQTPADFQGNRTLISVAGDRLLGLVRQADCSLTLRDSTYLPQIAPSFAYRTAASTDGFERSLHSLAGLDSIAGAFTGGCRDISSGATARSAGVFPATADGIGVAAGIYFDSARKLDQAVVFNADGDARFTRILFPETAENARGVTGGYFDDDRNFDLVSINDPAREAGPASLSIFPGKADGSFGKPAQLELTGTRVLGAAVEDLNNDGKTDIAATSHSGSTYHLDFFAGRGDGSFDEKASSALEYPDDVLREGNSAYRGLTALDLRNSGNKDLITAEGIVLLNRNGANFIPWPRAFSSAGATSGNPASLVAADFDKQDLPEIAVSNGAGIAVYRSTGNASYTKIHAYAGIDNGGHLAAADLDGDGHLDLYLGTAGNGIFGGGPGDFSKAYALMGLGDGRFAGAPLSPFGFTGTNLADLNGDGRLDGVGVNEDFSFAVYLGDGLGEFPETGRLPQPSVVWNGSPRVDSFALGDFDGNGKIDLAVVDSSFSGPGPKDLLYPGILIAAGDGQGGFAAPAFVAAPSFVPPGDVDAALVLSNLRTADVNGDGKSDLIYDYSDKANSAGTFYLGSAVQLSTGSGFEAPSQVIVHYAGQTASRTRSRIATIQETGKDGKPDLLFLAETGQATAGGIRNPARIELRRGNGTGGFGDPIAIPGPESMPGIFEASIGGGYRSSYYAPLAIADMDGDGNPDVVAVGSSKDGKVQVSVSKGDGNDGFGAAVLTTFAGQHLYTALAVADFNGDGKQDVALSSEFGASGNGIAFGNGDGSFQSVDGGLPNRGLHLLKGGPTLAVELNGDGLPDIQSGPVSMLSVKPVSTAALVPTTTALNLSANSIAAGEPVTLTAVVKPAEGSGAPAGAVTFLDGGTLLNQTNLSAGGSASFASSSLSVGTHRLTARYAGADGFAPSVSPEATLTVTDAPSRPTGAPTLRDSADPVQTGENFSYSLTFGNSGDSDMLKVKLKAQLSRKAKLLSVMPSQGDCKGRRPVSCSFGTLVPGEQRSVVLTVVQSKPGVARNKAVLSYKTRKPGSRKLKKQVETLVETTTVEKP